eukprot:scaffold53020_cov56-Attheya_sp.AAC.1
MSQMGMGSRFLSNGDYEHCRLVVCVAKETLEPGMIQHSPDCERKGGLTIWLVTHFDGMFTIIVIHTVDSMHRKYYILLRDI